MPAIEAELRLNFLPEHGLRPRRFLDELYRIVSRHPDYNRGAEPDFAPATPWWQVARHLLETFRRLVPEEFNLRLIHDDKGLNLQLYYQIDTEYQCYLADVAFLPHLKGRYRPLHDLTVSFLALLVERTAIGDWYQYLEQGIFHEWLSEQDHEEPEQDRKNILQYYSDPKGVPTLYHNLLHSKTERPRSTEELARRLKRLRSKDYPAPIQLLVEAIRDCLPVLDEPGISLAELAFPLSEEDIDQGGGWPVEPDEAIALVWNDHRILHLDEMRENHHYHIESQSNEYGFHPLGAIIDCRADEPYTIEKRLTEPFFKILSFLNRLDECGLEIKRHFHVAEGERRPETNTTI